MFEYIWLCWRDILTYIYIYNQISCSVMSNSLWPHGLQQARLPCPSPTSGAAQTHAHQVGDAIQASYPLSSPFPPAFNLSKHQALFQGVSSSHQMAFPFSRGSSQSKGGTQVSHIAGRFFTSWATGKPGRFFTNWAMREAHIYTCVCLCLCAHTCTC